MAGILLVALLIPLLAVVLDSAPARALATRLERGDPGGAATGERERLAALESEVERLSEQVASLEEQGRFLRQLLEERPPAPGLPPGDERGGGRGPS
ncbi:MAG TPA: hypothetical protein VK837_09790 [Longimicrobiales bacterium]|nr:hypothetical protein [Longimicrobiales bacterium]